MTTFADRLYQNGGVPVTPSLLGYGGGSEYFLDPTNGSDSYDGKTPGTAVKTWPVAYALLADGKHDILYLLSGSTGLTVAAQMLWAKSYTHLIGVGAPTQTGQRARIFSPLTGTISPLFNITGSGCVFENFYIVQQSVNASALIDVTLAGGRNYFHKVHFTGPNNSTNGVDGGCALNMSTGASENTFENCTFGVDTFDMATGCVNVMWPSSGGLARNRFLDCDFTLHAGNAGAAFMEFPAATGIDRYIIARNCTFINTATTQLTTGFVVNSDFGTTTTGDKKFIMMNCWGVGFPQFDITETHFLVGNMPAITSADLGGILVVQHA